MNRLFFLTLLLTASLSVRAQQFPLSVKEGKITYHADKQGNRIPDYSSCGYENSNKPIPDVENRVFVSWQEGDCSARIQQAIDYVSILKPDAQGFRGAVLLDEGTFCLHQPLRLTTSGVVLRGIHRDRTILKKMGTDRGAAIYVEGNNDLLITDTLQITNDYLACNSTKIAVNGKVEQGEEIMVYRPSTKAWIDLLDCDHFGGGLGYLGWKPGDIDLRWMRTVADVNGMEITLDAPLTMAIDKQLGAPLLLRYEWKGRIERIGVENLTIDSDYDTCYPMDEDHCWEGVYMDNATNCWVRRLSFRHLAGSAVVLQKTTSKVTVEDCVSTEPVSEIAGHRRWTFHTRGQQTLFQRCFSSKGIHDFSAGALAAGPNAFVQCEASEALGFSGSVGSWACGLLFDVVDIDGHMLSFSNHGQDMYGLGWNASNSMFWQCTAAEIECYSPAVDARNYAYGCWSAFKGNGEWGESNNHVSPRSLFYAQLQERMQMGDMGEMEPNQLECQARILPRAVNASSSPTVEKAMQLAREAYAPLLTLRSWIEKAPYTASVSSVGLMTVDALKPAHIKQIKNLHRQQNRPEKTQDVPQFALNKGVLSVNGALLAGGKLDVQWWNGWLKENRIHSYKPHVTRFVPGREGFAYTDRIDSTVNYMKRNNLVVLDHNYGLWLDRRRDDHERIRRRNADSWAPFYEQPFARSGQGKAWDGLTKYDLTRPNRWYWSRLRQFAEKGAEQGVLLYHENYFQHNILEAGAHWVDSPWRSANNINNTGFAEPVNFAGDKRIFVADMFYDVTHPVRRQLHRQYIRTCLNELADLPNVVQLVSSEYTGPLHFVQFWIDVIAEWEAETGKDALVALSATKDVQDAILDDPVRSKIVDIIDIRYWHYNTKELYAPKGGVNLAPRQHARKMRVGKVTYAEAYRAVSEYRLRYPEKAVTYYAQNYPAMAWAVAMAGGSCPQIKGVSEELLQAFARTVPMERKAGDVYEMVKSDTDIIIYSHSKSKFTIPVAAGKYMLKQVNVESGEELVIDNRLRISGQCEIPAASQEECVYWLHRL